MRAAGSAVPAAVEQSRCTASSGKITNGSANHRRSFKRLEELCLMVKETSLCGLGHDRPPNPIYSTLRYFRDEYEAHIKDHHCPAGVCHVYG